MRERFKLIFFSLVSLLLLTSISEAQSEVEGQAINERVVAANTEFALKLFDKIDKEDFSTNIFISPASITFALAMTYNGAAEETKAAMAAAMALDGFTLEEVNQANSALIKSLSDPDPEVKLSIANSLWARQGLEFIPEFLQRNQRYYQAEVSTLDFGNPESVSVINEWVSDATEGKIPKIIQEIKPEHILFLINAIYFKGSWTSKFEEAKTQERDFTLLDGSQKKHPLMSQSGNFQYFETDLFQAISLPYGNERVSMWVFLPDAASSLEEFHRNLTIENWKEWTKWHGKPKGTIVLPKFKQKYEISLGEPLIKLGMGLAFDKRKADFSNMVNVPEEIVVYIDEARHKTFVEVNEEGTEAAAVTSISISATSVSTEPPPFNMIVDHPFFCAIRDNETGTILFMGYIVDPQL
jgi:serpin B